MQLKSFLLTLTAIATLLPSASADKNDKPNVIIVITDDQGYGDFGFTGNPVIKTPNIDKLRSEGVLLDNFHVDPTCAPTRSALMTGRYSARVGVWHTVQGRNMLRTREVTMADVFTENGYATGLFGKWHLGDVYPYRPQDRGFQYVLKHQAGGVGQAPDYWGNDYFDDTYWLNGKLERFEGFCTDVFFDEGIEFIKANKEEPFFAYISTNAPHSPFYSPLEYSNPYKGNPDVSIPEFYGMITNIDDNMAKLMATLEEEGLADNTILIYMTDNGTAGGVKGGRGYDGGMRGQKTSEYDGGHRVPFILRWPAGQIEPGKSVEHLTAHLDILPTFIDLLGLKAPKVNFDGSSLRDLLYSDGKEWPERALVVESQRVVTPEKWRKSAVMTDEWRLINGKELYNMVSDPRQAKSVAKQFPEVFDRMRAEYEKFWEDVSQEHDLTSYMVIGSEESPIVMLSSHDWLINRLPPWNQGHIRSGGVAEVSYWAIEVEKAGEYEISLRRWPVEADKGINDGTYGKAFNYTQARMRIGDIDVTKEIPEGAKEVTFRVNLEKGLTELSPIFIGPKKSATPYYAYVTHKVKPGWQTPAGMGVPIYDPSFGRVPPQKKRK
ncbi:MULTISPECIES: arylsulfatase [unclassified Lentimonas]|uniref:arylsulfatase n=1 Tax=unclassified Lentimonas TaxID=2630993 RepID=UPI0013262813|nr:MULTISPECIES: arylsulfatase [unclassified Lentimonas]CAA6677827.1 Choline-sulfatase (EC [Lentimonas sp. CC4]CAA6683929.1 Choline-sulfatase (EC [Lentimonas sp. CC6]CAA7076693.1 Choline-sulfatase (EC [Lentimonas sp. CC4]CAA7169973.1 Choline-sulfatase (EC [Lentimonas sp. CC21]CAA7181262.1 Choline-sulfatase (EC [Lentimonas sp. CC8]